MKTLALIACLSSFLLVQPLCAQDPTPDTPPPGAYAVGQAQPGNDISAGAQPVEGSLSRWLAMNTLSFSYRYRNQADSDGFHIMDNGEERSLIDGRVKLDAEGKYSVNFHISSGRNFNWAFADNVGTPYNDLAVSASTRWPASQLQRYIGALTFDPAGLASSSRISRGWEMYVRELYLSATPIKQLTMEYGGLAIERGVNTEITSYDEDGYLAGERLRLHDPKHLFFDQIAVTYGYMGNYFDPNFFDRGDRLAHSNYHQFLVEKKLGHRLRASFDYTAVNRTDTLREAVLVPIRESQVLDSLRLELYQRTDTVNLQGVNYGTGAGAAFTASKTIAKKFMLEGGYASIDQYYGAIAGSRALIAIDFVFNGDSYGLGNRIFARANYKVDPYLTFFGFYSHEVATDYYNKNRQGMNFGMTVDFKNLLNDKFHLGIAPSSVKN